MNHFWYAAAPRSDDWPIIFMSLALAAGTYAGIQIGWIVLNM